jgi:HK97 family phage prohead protease
VSALDWAVTSVTTGRASVWLATVKTADAEAGVFTGTAVSYDMAVARGKDWDGFTLQEGVRAGAFAEQVKDPARVKILWQHDSEDPIGHVTGLADRPARLDFSAVLDIDPLVPNAGRVRAQLKSGTLSELSIGFDWDKWTEEVDEDARTRTIWHSRAQLREVSVVTWGAQGDFASAASVAAETGGRSVIALRGRRAQAQLSLALLAGLRS